MIKDDNLILSIAGHDPTGGAGIQVDAQIANHHGKHCLSILTCETIQNLKSFENLNKEEIYDHRKSKFLQIGRDQGFSKSSNISDRGLSYKYTTIDKLKSHINKNKYVQNIND